MNIVVYTEPFDGKYIYEIVSSDGTIELSGQGTSIEDAFAKAYSDYQMLFKQE